MMTRNEEDLIPTKRVAVQSSVWDACNQVIQGSQTSETTAAGDPVAESVDANRAAVMQMIRVYIADPTIDRMSDPLTACPIHSSGRLTVEPRSWLRLSENSCAHLQPACQVSASSVGLV